MNTEQFSIIKTTTFAKIELTSVEVFGRTSAELQDATREGQFSPVTATAADTVAVEIKPDGSAVIVVVAERVATTDTGNASS